MRIFPVLLFFIDLFTVGNNQRNLNFETEWRCHAYLIFAAERMNSVFTIPILMWITTMCASLIMQIYLLDVSYLDKYQSIDGILCTAFYIINLTELTAVCEWTSYEVN